MNRKADRAAADAVPTASIPWRERPHVRVQVAAEISGVSPATIYRLANDGRLHLKRLAGRVLVDTAELITFVDSAEPWSPSNRGAEARAQRAAVADAAWQD